jgi:hypothetical protein
MPRGRLVLTNKDFRYPCIVSFCYSQGAMPDLHQIIEAQLGTVDASDPGRRQEVYAEVRSVLMDTVVAEPERAEDYRANLEQAIAEIEAKYAAEDAKPPEPPKPELAAMPVAGVSPPRRTAAIAAAAIAGIAVVLGGLWLVGALPFTRDTVKSAAVSPPTIAQTPEETWTAAFDSSDAGLLNQAIDRGFKLDTSAFADAYIILFMQPSKALANPEFKTALRRLKDDIRPSICVGVTLANVAAVRDMVREIGAEEYRFYCGATKPALANLRSELSAEWRSTCKSLLPVEELAQRRVLDRDCMHDGFNTSEPIKWESGTAVPTFSRLARIRDAIVELEKLL